MFIYAMYFYTKLFYTQEMHNIRENASRKWMNKRRKEINDEISNSHDLSKSMDLFTKWVTYTTLSERQQQV